MAGNKVGHDPSEQFTFHWWDHLFNKSAANISVEAGQNGIQMKKLSEQDAISNKKPCKVPSTRSMLYGRFVKAATLTAGGEEPTKQVSTSESSEDEEMDLSTARKLTDEELVRACGGRTAHKGARHGLTMSAKLARLEEQERAFLAKYGQEQRGRTPEHQQEATLEASGLESSSPAERKTKKKKWKRSPWRAGCAEAQGSPDPAGEEKQAGKKRKKKKEGCESRLLDSREQQLMGAVEQPESGTARDGPGKRTKKKKARKRQVQ
ncbi:G patch domain-containing protein 4 isoform X2 [Carettochelys insculpta]|uniref:G patch domain-containing protein 4 isoform X2 n=1 Tax=Carettochelys insculpta TaxID=44489 RepID=UPI003EBED439